MTKKMKDSAGFLLQLTTALMRPETEQIYLDFKEKVDSPYKAVELFEKYKIDYVNKGKLHWQQVMQAAITGLTENEIVKFGHEKVTIIESANKVAKLRKKRKPYKKRRK